MHFNEAKFSELVVYIAAQCASDRLFGMATLHHALFFSDFTAYHQRGSAITGAAYQKLVDGPAPRAMLHVRQKLVASGAIEMREEQLLLRPQFRLVALRLPDVSGFEEGEVTIVDDVVAAIRSLTTTEVNRRVHEMPGWRLAQFNEKIAYCSALIPDAPLQPTEEAFAFGLRVVTAQG